MPDPDVNQAKPRQNPRGVDTLTNGKHEGKQKCHNARNRNSSATKTTICASHSRTDIEAAMEFKET